MRPVETWNPEADEEEEPSGGERPVRAPLERPYVVGAEGSRPVVRHRASLARLGRTVPFLDMRRPADDLRIAVVPTGTSIFALVSRW